MCRPTDIEKGLKEEEVNGVKEIWHVLEPDQCLRELGVDRRNGLSSNEAQERLAKYGPNQLTEKEKKTLLQRIWEQVNNVLVGILVIVACVSTYKATTAKASEDRVTNWLEVGLIIFVVTLNAWIGIIQEGSAEKAADALKAMLSSNAEVIRDGKNCEVPGNEVVPGDLVVIKLGDRIPADVRMIDVSNLACQEAALTGESLPIDKVTQALPAAIPEQVPLGDRKNMCFSATLCSQGRGVGLVVATGDNTQIGKINGLVNQVETKKTNVQKQIDFVSKWIAGFVMTCAIITFMIAFFVTDLPVVDSVSIALVCAVAMIPEGLASIVSLTYAWAVSKMTTMNAIVRALPAVETLGSVNVICSDKTGTLTKNVMTLNAFITSNTRYKFNTDYTGRTPTNFVRDDTYLVTRAALSGGKDKKHLNKKVSNSFNGANGDINHHYGEQTKQNSNHTEITAADSSDESSGADGPVVNGESPSMDFFRSAMAGGVLCGNSVLGENGGREGEIGNPTELAILRAAYFANVNTDDLKQKAPQIAEVPFSSEYKFMATVHKPVSMIDGSDTDGNLVVHVKGAPDRMIPLCSSQARAGLVGEEEAINSKYWIEQVSILSSYGLRVLALCRGAVSEDEVKEGAQLDAGFVRERGGPWLTIVGLCAIMDPPRPECVDAIIEAHRAGVRVAMITGDHKDTALAIGDMLGLVDEKYNSALTGPELDAMNEKEMRSAVMSHNIFARASPENKIQIVEALQAEGQICSMTGDGVNDAPALKKANMGVAMGLEGTDVAREASEMILADDNFATIVSAVREGRTVWDNLRKVLLVNTPINNAQGLSVLFGMVFGLEDTILTPIQVLYCNLICAVTLGFVLAIEPAEDGIMNLPPRKPSKRLIGRFLLLRILLGSMILVTVTVGSVFWVRHLGYDLDAQRSQASNTLTFSAISVCLSARFAYNSSLHPRIFFGNKYCWWSIIPLVCIQLLITYIPGLNSLLFGMSPQDGTQWGIVILGMVLTFLVMEGEKAIRRILKSDGVDTDDRQLDPYFDEQQQR